MQLAELFLDRHLYRDNNQGQGTKDSAFVSADSSEPEPSYLASGGAAQDINTGNVQIDGAQLEPGTFPQTVLDVSNWGWGQTCAFSSTDLNTVSWEPGTFTSADGTSYAISAGNTGNMSDKTYIYLSLLESETVYQTSTTPGDSVGLGKVLVAVAQNAADAATFMLSEATQIVGDNIIANSINASKITTGQLIVGTNVGIGSAFPDASAGDLAYQDLVGAALLDSTVIVGGYIKTSLLTADNITTGTLNAIDITGTTITGSTIQTGTSGYNINISSTELQLRNGGSVIGTLKKSALGSSSAITVYNADLTIAEVSGYIIGSGSRVQVADNLSPYSDGSYYLGDSSYGWGRCYLGTSGYYLYTSSGTLVWSGGSFSTQEIFVYNGGDVDATLEGGFRYSDNNASQGYYVGKMESQTVYFDTTNY